MVHFQGSFELELELELHDFSVRGYTSFLLPKTTFFPCLPIVPGIRGDFGSTVKNELEL